MADEHNSSLISKPASTVARYAGALSNVPTIGPFMRATAMGANTVAAIAKIFGYSAPVELERNYMIPAARDSMATVDKKDPAVKLTVDSKQELTIDPSTTGIRSDDELPIASIAGRESYIDSFEWTINNEADHLLWNTIVDPGLKAIAGPPPFYEHHFPACALAALPFKYWRGTMRLRFQVVSSEYHKGRIRIVYDPVSGSTSANFNTHYTTIHDISNEKDFTVDIGWAQTTPYRESIKFSNVDRYGTSPIAASPTEGNGNLSVYVLNPLTTPGTVVANIQVNVFISMLDDFEVASPTDDISFCRFRAPVIPVPLLRTIPEMDAGAVMDCCDNAITDPPVIDTFNDTMLDDPDITKLFFGEVIGSFRQLLKRTCRAELRLIPENPGSSLFVLNRQAFPIQGGHHDAVPAAGTAALVLNDGIYYLPYHTTYLNYLSRAFIGWRGSIRWTVDASTLNQLNAGEFANSISYSLSRNTVITNSQQSLEISTTNLASAPLLLMEGERGSGLRGMHLSNTQVNPIQSVEIPYYRNERFSLTSQALVLDGVPKEGPAWDFSVFLQGSQDLANVALFRTFVSAGEDFNFFFFNGMPPIFVETEYPLDPPDP
jgi:hypothetical protein